VYVVGRKAPKSFYQKDLVSFDELGAYDQKDAEGFIRIQALRLRVRALVEGKGHGA
jgi:argininosuccinate synthase